MSSVYGVTVISMLEAQNNIEWRIEVKNIEYLVSSMHIYIYVCKMEHTACRLSVLLAYPFSNTSCAHRKILGATFCGPDRFDPVQPAAKFFRSISISVGCGQQWPEECRHCFRKITFKCQCWVNNKKIKRNKKNSRTWSQYVSMTSESGSPMNQRLENWSHSNYPD